MSKNLKYFLIEEFLVFLDSVLEKRKLDPSVVNENIDAMMKIIDFVIKNKNSNISEWIEFFDGEWVRERPKKEGHYPLAPLGYPPDEYPTSFYSCVTVLKENLDNFVLPGGSGIYSKNVLRWSNPLPPLIGGMDKDLKKAIYPKK